jgi:hypothetical protein
MAAQKPDGTLMTLPSSHTFVTRDLTPGEYVRQAGWAKAQSGLLDRLEVEGTRITLRRRNGAVDELQMGAFRCTSYRTGSGRRLFVIKTNDGRKIRFLEMTGMLSDDEWNTIAHDVLAAHPSNLTNIVTRAGISVVLGMLASAVSAGLLAGMFDLSPEQVVISSPLSIGLLIVWIPAIWFGFRFLHWLE